MRPYSSRKDGDVAKYQSNQQSSPLALLAATCNKIGDSTSFSDTFHKDKEFTTVKSCGSDTPRLSPFVSIDRNYNYATTLKHHEPKKDVIAETRSHEAFERTVFSKSSCSHFDNPSYVASQEVTFPQCAHSSENSSSSSCLFESNTDSSSHHHTHPQQSSCAMEDLNFQGSALHNLTQQNSPVLTTIPSIIPPSYHNSPNYSKSYQWPSTYREQPQKSSCMVQEDFENNNIPTLQSLSTVRTTRTSSLSHISTPVSPHHPLPSPSQSPFMQQYNNPSFPQQLSPQHQQAFPHYSSHNSPVDIKQEPMMMPPSNFRPPVSPYTSPTMSYPEPLQSDLKWSSNHSLRHHEPMPGEHNHPAGMTSSFCPACNSPSGVSYPPPPGSAQTIGLPPHMTPQNEMMRGMAEMSEYHYQQQQMFYARDNRRPRRIACTCPNCRDGENKTVTTKDGKQRKLHICHVPGCGKVYGKTSHLRAHLRWHAGERPFACNWLFCNKRFTRSDELQRHRRTHTGDKRFECSVCLKKFMRSDHLSKHMKTHQAQIKKSEEKTKTPVATPTTMTTLDNKSAGQKVKTEIVENK